MFALHPLSYDHPDAQELTERAQAYYVEVYGGRDDDPLTAAEFAEPQGGFVVGYRDGTPVAMGGWTHTAGDPGERVAKIRRMYVDPAARRQGLAATVLDHLETAAARHGVTRIILATGAPQLAAISFYRRHGYTDIAPFGYYADSDQVVCLGKTVCLGETVSLGETGGSGPQPTS